MGYFQYSPWQDAAQYGQGLGNSLGQILLQMPMLRKQQAIEQQKLSLQQQLQGAQIADIQAQTQQRNALARSIQQNLDLRKQAIDAITERERIRAGAVKGRQSATNPTLNRQVFNEPQVVANQLGAQQGVDANTPIGVPSSIQQNMPNFINELIAGGVNPGLAMSAAPGLFFGTNATLQPNVQQTVPAQPAGFFGLKAAVPAAFSTNSYSVQPGGINQLSLQSLLQQSNAAPVLQRYGFGTNQQASVPSQQPQPVPPPAMRQVGQTYMTPKGPFVWTGHGWQQ